jgi:hypothetical protein
MIIDGEKKDLRKFEPLELKHLQGGRAWTFTTALLGLTRWKIEFINIYKIW